VTLIDGRTADGVHVRVDGAHANNATVWINGERRDIARSSILRDGGSWFIVLTDGTRIVDRRNALPRDPGRIPTLNGEQIT
jgi:hypothetical protein